MEASAAPATENAVPEPQPQASAPSAVFDVSPIHALLDQVDATYHELFDGRIPDEVHRFEQFLLTVRQLADQAADSAAKES